MDALSAARELYHVAKNDAALCAQIRAAYRTAVISGMMTKDGLNTIITASKNGSTMTMMQGMPEADRIKALRYALQWIDAGAIPAPGRAMARF
jgi:hypothetical protein